MSPHAIRATPPISSARPAKSSPRRSSPATVSRSTSHSNPPRPTDRRADPELTIDARKLVRNGHGPTKQQRELIVRQRLHDFLDRHARCHTARLRPAPDLPGVAIQPRGPAAGMMKHDHRIAGARHLYLDTPVRSVRSPERFYLSCHLSFSLLKSAPVDAAAAVPRIPHQPRAST